MKPWGKKNPASQKQAGWPLRAHCLMKFSLSYRSCIQEASGFREGNETFAQLPGTVQIQVRVHLVEFIAHINLADDGVVQHAKRGSDL